MTKQTGQACPRRTARAYAPGQREEERPAEVKARALKKRLSFRALRPGGRRIEAEADMGREGGSAAAERPCSG